MKNVRVFLSENFQFLEVKLSIYMHSRVFVMRKIKNCNQMTNIDMNKGSDYVERL